MRKKFLILSTLLLIMSSCGGGNPSGDSGGALNADDMNVILKRDRITQNPDYSEVIYSFYDEAFNYYVFKMGTITNTPLEHTSRHFEYRADVDNYEHVFHTSVVNTESILLTTSNTFYDNTSFTNTQSFNYSAGGKVDVIELSAKLELAWSQSGSSGVQFSESYETASSVSKTESHTVTISFKNSKYGCYRYILMGVVDTYLTVAQSRENKNDYYSYYLGDIRSVGYALEYAETYEEFLVESEDEFVFDASILTNIEEPTQFVSSGEVESPIRQEFTPRPIFCRNDNGYIPTPNVPEDDKERHDNFDMGKFVLDGCVEEAVGNKKVYRIVSESGFSLKYETLQYPHSLPYNNGDGQKLSKDTYVFSGEEYPFAKNIAVEYGLMVAVCNFDNDGNEKIIKHTNFFDGKTKGDVTTIVDNIETHSLQSIKIHFFYETYVWKSGFLGWDEMPNWYTSFEICF